MKFDFQKREQLRFSEVNYLNYIKKDPILHVATIFSLKQGETRTSHGPIPHPLTLHPRENLPYLQPIISDGQRGLMPNRSCVTQLFDSTHNLGSIYDTYV